MSDHPPFTVRYMVLRYLVVTVLTAVAVYVVYLAVEAFFGLDPATGSGIVVAIIPAMDAGNVFARRSERLPAKGEAWRLSGILFAVHIAFSAAALMTLGVVGVGLDTLAGLMAMLNTSVGYVGIVVILLLYFLAIRWFFGTGAKSELRRAERLASKGK